MQECDARRTLELDLRSALAEGAFELHSSADRQHRFTHGHGAGVALLRWNHLATRLGATQRVSWLWRRRLASICAIGQWVLFKACREATKWPKHHACCGKSFASSVQAGRP